MKLDLKKQSKDEKLSLEKLLRIRNRRITLAKKFHLNTKGEPMNFADNPHLIEIYENIAREMAIQGSVQSFKSEYMIIDQFACALEGLSVFYVLPKYESRNAYVQNRIDKCMDSVPYYKKIINAGNFNNQTMKQFGKGVIKYVGSNVPGDFVEFPADVMFVEEVDQCNMENVHMANDRLRASRYQYKRYVGNPSFKGQGINYFYGKSTQKAWHVPCRQCGFMNILDWFKVIVQEVRDREGIVTGYKLRDHEWKSGKEIRPVCQDCHQPFSRHSHNGEWTPQNPESTILGYWMTMLLSKRNSVAEMWGTFEEAWGDEHKLQLFYNSILGMTYESQGSKVTPELLKKYIQKYRLVHDGDRSFVPTSELKLRARKKYCSMGVDVGKYFDVRVSEVDDFTGSRKLVFSGKVKDENELVEIGKEYNVEACVIDSMPETRIAREFQANAPFYVWLCRYNGEGIAGVTKWDSKQMVVSCDRTWLLDKTFAEIKKGRNIFPENIESAINGDLIKEMCGTVRTAEKDNKGNLRYVWSKCADHQRHADGYDYLASTLMVNAGVNLSVSIG